MLFNGTDTTVTVFKDGEVFSNMFPVIIQSPTNDDFGTYTFGVTTERCGSTMAVSRITRGQFKDIFCLCLKYYYISLLIGEAYIISYYLKHCCQFV